MTSYYILKDFAGPVATIFAALAAVGVTGIFAWRQTRLAREKLRYDLFDRRLAVFESVFPLYEALLSGKAHWTNSKHKLGFLKHIKHRSFYSDRILA